MRCLNRNSIGFYYAVYQGSTPVLVKDEYGNEIETGEYEVSYDEPEYARGNISPAKGAVAVEVFGSAEGYDRVLVIDDPDTPIDEYTVLWVDTDDTDEPYDYIVRKVARSLNSASIAISKVNVQ
nr:MAG TPA: hypothetical protein [Caudoviricetes sp.]